MQDDFFKLLGTGIRFNKRKFAEDVKIFEDEPEDNAHIETQVTKVHTKGTDIPRTIVSFQDLITRYQCPAKLLSNAAQMGLASPTPIQSHCIPILLEKRELFGCAPTGSGKTASYALPILIRLATPSKDGVRAVIVSPTRELAQQIHRYVERLAKGLLFRIRLLTHINEATVSDSPPDILITTPMRMANLLKEADISLSKCELLVLDEADKLFEMGMLEQVDEVFAAVKDNTTVVRAMFSATLPEKVEDTARTVMHDPIRVVVGKRQAATKAIKQKLTYVGNETGKLIALRQLLKEGVPPPVIIFVQSVDRAKELHRELKLEGHNVDVIHSDRTPQEREEVVQRFRLGEIFVLVATDLLARGMDFKGIRCVVNFDFPQSTISYIHRIGRTGRAGRPGEAITFFTDEDTELLRSIAHVMRDSGCEVQEWMLSLKRISKERRKDLAVRPIDRQSITAASRRRNQRDHAHAIVPGVRGRDSDEEDESDAAAQDHSNADDDMGDEQDSDGGESAEDDEDEKPVAKPRKSKTPNIPTKQQLKREARAEVKQARKDTKRAAEDAAAGKKPKKPKKKSKAKKAKEAPRGKYGYESDQEIPSGDDEDIDSDEA
eukprot:TRINITY_DN13857_c0_g1_i1.p1 TRINITY_DN13857_c0_g1~~TRINITY_DN13857_c0_g1_i1.p1  ORF type:complete len:605 (+),score=135.24 TRINITY_DN13857_c0_g1_i1:43-1857(+)